MFHETVGGTIKLSVSQNQRKISCLQDQMGSGTLVLFMLFPIP